MKHQHHQQLPYDPKPALKPGLQLRRPQNLRRDQREVIPLLSSIIQLLLRGPKLFLRGLPKAAERNLPPGGVKLPPAPVPQILPAEIQEAHDTEGTTAYNRKEDAMLQRLAKMDDVELTTRVGQAKQHPLFAMFEQDVIQPEHDDCSELIYFGLDPNQDLCEFYMYLDTQGCDQSQQADILKDIQQQPPPDQDPPEDCEVESTQMDPQTDKDQSPMTDQTAAELASKASATTSPVPGKLLPDNQLGDSSLFPPPSPVAPATPSPGPTPVAPAIVHPPHVTTAKPERLPAEREPTDLFKPVTREGMRAFWAVMKRQSTDSLLASPAPSHDLPSPAPSPAPVQAVPTASPVPTQTTSSASPVPSATSPVPSQTVPNCQCSGRDRPNCPPSAFRDCPNSQSSAFTDCPTYQSSAFAEHPSYQSCFACPLSSWTASTSSSIHISIASCWDYTIDRPYSTWWTCFTSRTHSRPD